MQGNSPCICMCNTTEHAKLKIMLPKFLPQWKRIHSHYLLTFSLIDVGSGFTAYVVFLFFFFLPQAFRGKG